MLGEYDELYLQEIYIRDYIFNFLKKSDIDGKTVNAKPRFSSAGNEALLKFDENENLKVVYKNKNTQNSRGQHVVFYDGDIVLGGGIIK